MDVSSNFIYSLPVTKESSGRFLENDFKRDVAERDKSLFSKTFLANLREFNQDLDDRDFTKRSRLEINKEPNKEPNKTLVKKPVTREDKDTEAPSAFDKEKELESSSSKNLKDKATPLKKEPPDPKTLNSALLNLIKQIDQFLSAGPSLEEGLKADSKNLLTDLKELFKLFKSNQNQIGGDLALDKKITSWLAALKNVDNLPKDLKHQINHLLLAHKNSQPDKTAGHSPAKNNINRKENNRMQSGSHSTFQQSPNTQTHSIVNHSSNENLFNKSLQAEGINSKEAKLIKLDSTKMDNFLTDKFSLNQELNKLYSPQTREIEPQRILSRLVNQIQSAVVNHKDQVVLKLYPEHLGKVTVHLNKEEGIFTAKLIVDSQAVKELLESKMQNLKDHLNGAGLSFSEVSIDLSDNEQKQRDQIENLEIKADQKKAELLDDKAEVSNIDLYRTNPNGLLDLIA